MSRAHRGEGHRDKRSDSQCGVAGVYKVTSDGIWWKFEHESRRVPLDAEDNTVCGVRGAQRGQMVNGSDPSLDEGKPRLDLSFNFLPQRCSTGTWDLCSLPLCPFFSNRSLTKQRCVPWKEGRRKRHPPTFPPQLSAPRCPLLARDKD